MQQAQLALLSGAVVRTPGAGVKEFTTDPGAPFAHPTTGSRSS
ncbi:MAG TPA: hypothetical protein PLB97_00175 [Accumulibacter sp.]|nr:hypothetical protein [Accumulibacter sp.]